MRGIPDDVDYTAESTVAYALGLGWQQRGDAERAIDYFEKAIAADDRIHAAYVKLMMLRREAGDWDEVVDISRRGVRKFPWTAYLHNSLTEGLVRTEGFDAAAAEYRLVPRFDGDVTLPDDAIVSISIVRNERVRLPEFLRDARQSGAEAFFVVDNGSTDGTVEYLLEQPDVWLWSTELPFRLGSHGAGWFEILLRRHARGHWILMLDADELLRYPGCETEDLHALTDRLDRRGLRAFEALTLDMYSGGPLAEARYAAEQPFLDVTPFFDRTTHHRVLADASPFNEQKLYLGGLRARIFGDETDFWLTKTPLIRYDTDTVLVSGQHFSSRPADEVLLRAGAVLHFKYFSTFVDHVRIEAEREQHASLADCYKAYDAVAGSDAELSFFDPDESVRYESGDQLVELGIVDPATVDVGRPS